MSNSVEKAVEYIEENLPWFILANPNHKFSNYFGCNGENFTLNEQQTLKLLNKYGRKDVNEALILYKNDLEKTIQELL